MEIQCVWEHNGNDTLLHAIEFPGAYARGATLREAVDKMPAEIRSYCAWAGILIPDVLNVRIVQDAPCDLAVSDADSDVLFELEQLPLTMDAYTSFKALAMKSAADFHRLYQSFPDSNVVISEPRHTFYGNVPVTAEAMYQHTKNVNGYYFGEIGVGADNEGDIVQCRLRGFEKLEQHTGYLTCCAGEGSYGEWWSLRKVLRRFLWHDRIHARAMYRRGLLCFQDCEMPNVFCF